MALQVASMLDEVAFKKEWRETITTTLNNALLSIKVSPGYSIVVSLANRNYLLESGDSTRLAISTVPDQAVARAVSKAKARVVVSPAALKDVEDMGNEWNEIMLEKRRLQIQGDQVMFNKLHNELQSHLTTLQNKVEAAGPGAGNLMRAIEEHNATVEKTGQEFSKVSEELVVQMAHLTADAADWLPPLMKMHGWVLFSAISSMQGNMGQSNYCCANMCLDAQTFSMRTTNSDNFMPVTVMWGAIGNLGMRLKAFGSQDMLAMVDNTDDVLMTPMEAKEVLTYLINGYSPEWVGAWKNTKEYNDHFMLGWAPLRPGQHPWGKGKGGGLSFESSLNGRPEVDSQKASEPLMQSRDRLSPGRRVRTQGLVLNAELNGVKGTLVEEAEPGVWHVLLDGGLGEKLLKVRNFTTDSKPQIAKKNAASSTSIREDPDELCIAGTWGDWMPQDMQWNAEQQCHTCQVSVSGAPDTKFGVNRGKAGTKKWAARPKQWSMGNVVGSYQIKVFMKSHMVDRVEWDKLL